MFGFFKKLLTIFYKIMTEENLMPPGLIEDPRDEEAKSKDYPHKEVAPMAIALNWNRDISGAPVYSLRDQNGSGSCVAQTAAKSLEIITGIVQSAHPTYRRRLNFPNMGMWLQDAGNIIKNLGTTTEELDPSQKQTEAEMNRDITVETPLKGFLYAFPNIKNIDEIAQAIEVYKHCFITFNGNLQEYAYSEKPVIIPGAPLDCPHCITGVYYFTDEHGEKCIVVDESWGPNFIRRRVLTETYLNGRGTAAMYLIKPVPPQPPVKPHYQFTKSLLFGQNSDAIKVLQDILKYEGLFPLSVASTGYYGPITAKWVLAFQKKYQVASNEELDELAGHRVGPKTVAKLNQLYNN